MFLLGFIIFCVVPELMAYIWIHIFHIPRAILGFMILKRFPRSHDIVAKLQIPDNHSSLKQISTHLTESVSQILLGYLGNCKCLLQVYCGLTLAAGGFDIVDFIVQYIRFGKFGAEHSCLMMLALICIFLALDGFYFLWIFQAKEKLPTHIAAYVQRALFGFAEEMTNSLIENAKKAVSRASFSSRQKQPQ